LPKDCLLGSVVLVVVVPVVVVVVAAVETVVGAGGIEYAGVVEAAIE
jgi:hypothetical protein